MTAEELKSLAIQLHERMTTDGELLFLPTGGAFLKISLERLDQLRDPKTRPPDQKDISNADAWGVYTEWHESVHLAQLVTSPYVSEHAFLLAALASRTSSRTNDCPNAELTADRELYWRLRSKLSSGAPAYSPQMILETQAVCLGLQSLTSSNDGASLLLLANFLYEDAPQYVRLLNTVAEHFGSDEAFLLLPQLCFIALQSRDPTTTMLSLLETLSGVPSIDVICTYGPRAFCEWADIDPTFVTRSLRERAKTLTHLDGRPLGLHDHPWMQVFSRYFDDFEQIASVDERLEMSMSARSPIRRVFRPTFTVFGDGGVVLREGSSEEAKEHENELIEAWLRRTLEMLDGLKTLSQERPVAEATGSRSKGQNTTEGNDEREQRRALEYLAKVAERHSRFGAAREYLEQARQMSVDQNDVVAEAVYLNNLTVVMARAGDSSAACQYANQAIEICEGDKSARPLIVTLSRHIDESDRVHDADWRQKISVSNLLRGEFEEDSRAALDRAFKLKEVEGNAHGNLALIARIQGNVEVARAEYQRSLQFHEEIGFLPEIASTLEALGELAFQTGNPQEACTSWRRAIKFYERTGNRSRVDVLMSRFKEAEMDPGP